MKLYLDDIRPAPVGWELVTTVAAAQVALSTGTVDELSLDHDLGACELCTTIEANQTDGPLWKGSMPHCKHVGTGYDLVCWMEANDVWPPVKPVVHSLNPVGRQRMQQVIDKHYTEK